MSSINIIVTIILLLAALVCYAFIAQTLKQKRELRNRLLAALKVRSRTFKFMLNGFPAGFLPRELTMLVQRSLIEVCENLTRLEPKEPAHLQDLQAISSMLADTQRHAKPPAEVTLNNPQQIKEVKICLEELNRFIHNLESKNSLSHNQAESYRNQIRQLVVQLTVDNYTMQGRAADQASKLKLALHFYDLAVKLLIREGKPGKYNERIATLKERIHELSDTLPDTTREESLSDEEKAEQEAIANEWDKFGSEDKIWKKKHVYD